MDLHLPIETTRIDSDIIDDSVIDKTVLDNYQNWPVCGIVNVDV